MANFIKGAIVDQLPVSAEPGTAYFLGDFHNGFSFHVADDNGDVRAITTSGGGVITVNSVDEYVQVDNSDPKNPKLSLNVGGLFHSVVAESSTLKLLDALDTYTLELNPDMPYLVAGDNITLERTGVSTVIKADVPTLNLPEHLESFTSEDVKYLKDLRTDDGIGTWSTDNLIM